MKEAIYIHPDQDNPVPLISTLQAIQQASKIVSPVWSLDRAIACNPLKNLEDLPFEEAVEKAAHYFQQPNIPNEMKEVNREVIKWCQIYTDKGQATFSMPGKEERFYSAWKGLATYDNNLFRRNKQKAQWLKLLPEEPERAIAECLFHLHIKSADYTEFLTLIFSTLPGWPSYLGQHIDYLAVKLAITCMLWPNAQALLQWHRESTAKQNIVTLDSMLQMEKAYKNSLLETIKKPNALIEKEMPDAQIVFCIDVRSEPLRRALEAQGKIETFGFAGFFGLPIAIKHDERGEPEDACPVLMSSKHVVEEKRYYAKKVKKHINRFYESLKYTFTTPFALAETIGPWLGIWMVLKTAFPIKTLLLQQKLCSLILQKKSSVLETNGIPFDAQCNYAESVLRMMGLTQAFAPFVILCGHASTSQNNPHAAGLDCGACGGRPGGVNAKVLAKILNTLEVQLFLKEKGILIPPKTRFIAAEHNTTLNTLDIFDQTLPVWLNQKIERACSFSTKNDFYADWAQTRPEWGLAGNASFIVGPRSLSESIDLDGRSFLHSYEWESDANGSFLELILTGPMVVAQWINMQYLFSTRNNVAYGCGNKTTHNVTGKMGVMQGNGSDLMHGLSLQSVAVSDQINYHEPIRLLTIVYAPTSIIDEVIQKQPGLQKLFRHGWVHLCAILPGSDNIVTLKRDLTWSNPE